MDLANELANQIYDVVIMGGGPAGSTLGALLARQTKLRVAIFEKDFFPREHIGESFSHRVTSVLEESGALPKVLASQCWVRKFGGFYVWEDVPAATYFDPGSAERDGVLRWSIHCNRSEFDQILLEHARSSGVDVFEGVSVTSAVRDGDTWLVELGEAGSTRAKIFVEASGRQTSLVTGAHKAFLSQYKNIAIWNHVLGGKPAQSLPGDWNIFREKNISPIGNFTFEDGWFWYIPVPKIIMGERKLTHSLGMVTDPRVLRDPEKRYTDPIRLFEKAKQVRLLRDLIADAQPVSDKVLTATNYSMISETFCDFDQRWMLIGDAAYFVDPLFSSGVAFALMHAAAAASVIRWSFEGDLSNDLRREMWEDYAQSWQSVARSFALSIDQWYHAIAVNNPSSVYWQVRVKEQLFEARSRPFQALVDTGVSPDLLRVLSKGSDRFEDLGADGPLIEALLQIKDGPKGRIALKKNVGIKESVTVDPVAGKAAQSRDPSVPIDPAAARYWEDPVLYADRVAPNHGQPRKCHRFFFTDGPKNALQLRFDDALHGGRALHALLSSGPRTRAELDGALSQPQKALLARLHQAGMLEIGF